MPNVEVLGSGTSVSLAAIGHEGNKVSSADFERDLFAFCDRALTLLVRKGAAEFDVALDEESILAARRTILMLNSPASDARYLLNCLIAVRRGLTERKIDVARFCERVVMFIGAFDKFCQKRGRIASSARAATEVWG